MSELRKRFKRLPLPTNPGGIVYGTILIATLISAESAKAQRYSGSLAAIAIAELVYWLAISYSEFTGDRAAKNEPFELRGFWRSAQHELAVVQGGAVPFLVIVVCWIVGASLSTALTLGVYTAAGMIVVTELAIGLSTEESGRELLLDTVVGVAFGMLVIAVKVIMH
jgi:hypothetical protein